MKKGQSPVTGPAAWPHLRRKPERLGRHRKLPVVTESQMPPVTPASLPQHDYRASMPPRPIAVATPVPAEPEPDVQCGWCKVIGPLSQIPGSHGWYRCAKVWECIPRQLASGLPSEMPDASPLEPPPGPEVPVLPPAQEEALAAFEPAHAEQDAAEGKDGSEDEEPPEAVTEPPAGTTEPAPVAAETEPKKAVRANERPVNPRRGC